MFSVPGRFLKIAVVGACLAAAPAFAGPIGSLVAEGAATIHVAGNGSAVEARGTHTVFAGDQIETGAAGARLMLQDGSVVNLAPSSRMVVRSANGSDRSIELMHGRMSLDARTDGWSVFSAEKDRTGVSAGSSMEFEVQSTSGTPESEESLEDRRAEPAPRPRSFS